MFLSIVIPAYNETDNLERGALEKVAHYLSKQAFEYEVIIVDDGSIDNSPLVLEEYASKHKHWRVIKNSHQGKAQTVARGVKEAKGELVLFTDFDQATPLSEVEKLLPFVRKKYDIVIGSREVKGSQRLKEPWHRHLMGRGFNFLVSLIALRGIQDTQCGFKLLKTPIAQDLFSRLIVYGPHPEKGAFTGAFDVEMLYLAQKSKYKIAEVPVRWKHVKTTRVNPIKDSIRMFFDLVRIRLTDIMGKYNEV